jgi:hypothetical protein
VSVCIAGKQLMRTSKSVRIEYLPLNLRFELEAKSEHRQK